MYTNTKDFRNVREEREWVCVRERERRRISDWSFNHTEGRSRKEVTTTYAARCIQYSFFLFVTKGRVSFNYRKSNESPMPYCLSEGSSGLCKHDYCWNRGECRSSNVWRGTHCTFQTEFDNVIKPYRTGDCRLEIIVNDLKKGWESKERETHIHTHICGRDIGKVKR